MIFYHVLKECSSARSYDVRWNEGGRVFDVGQKIAIILKRTSCQTLESVIIGCLRKFVIELDRVVHGQSQTPLLHFIKVEGFDTT